MELDRTTVDTEAGQYHIVEYYDTGGGNGDPLKEYDHPGMSFAVYSEGRYQTLNTLSGNAGNAVQTWLDHGYDDDQIERRFGLWKAITEDRTELHITEVWASRSTWYRAIALVDYDPLYPDWDRKASAVAKLDEFEAWSRGEVYGYVVEGPDGEHLDSCWGFIGDDDREYMIEQAKDIIEHDAKERFDSVAMAGAGFVGII